ncbi:zinc finger protein 664-like [Erpetoichthys calabaricus]|uniref:Zinc finger protein 664-like n=1 Tax=Erpetoichthys calabaricus TaxID=27687 RepID=A0A8C4XDB9_ERPCA|nr:zinc finger protein 664-like [Erpetoichthys calabaricus]XP_051783514.1 zinc finger protein 664-like [Erpetoichthys calabaricus]
MASADDNGVDRIKEEDCEWGPESFCVKQEDHNESVSILKVDQPEEGVVRIKIEAVSSVKEDVTPANQCGWQEWPTLQGRKRGQRTSQRLSAESGNGLPELEEPINEARGRLGETRGNSAVCLQEDDQLFSSFAQTFSQHQSQQKKHINFMWKSTSTSETGILDPLECGSLPFVNQSHSRNHNVEKPHCCSECGKQFSKRKNLKIHTRIHTGVKPHCCSECGKRFSHSSSLQIHTRIHTGEKPYSCSECGKQFTDSSSLQRHIRIHSGEKPYFCTECGKRFLYLSGVKSHSRVHSGEKPYCCSECGKRFSQISNLKNHTRIHTGEKPHCCFECGKRFSKINNLKIHTRIHTGEKRFSCSECGKQFTDNRSLQSHSRIHTGEKPYRCSECGKEFSRKNSLRRHTRVHTGEKPYCCSECGKAFSQLSSLQSHTRIHTTNGPNNREDTQDLPQNSSYEFVGGPHPVQLKANIVHL